MWEWKTRATRRRTHAFTIYQAHADEAYVKIPYPHPRRPPSMKANQDQVPRAELLGRFSFEILIWGPLKRFVFAPIAFAIPTAVGIANAIPKFWSKTPSKHDVFLQYQQVLQLQ